MHGALCPLSYTYLRRVVLNGPQKQLEFTYKCGTKISERISPDEGE